MRVYRPEEISPTLGTTTSIVLVTHLGRKEKVKIISTIEGKPEEGMVSFEGDKRLVKT
jgi:hypothetical protein